MLTLSRNADIALKSLPPTERSQVLMSLEYLENFESERLANQQLVERLPLKNKNSYDAVYIMRVADQLRVVFAVADQQQEPDIKQIVVLDIFDHDRLKTMHEN
jgi:hypothetical protein